MARTISLNKPLRIDITSICLEVNKKTNGVRLILEGKGGKRFTLLSQDMVGDERPLNVHEL